MLFRSDNYRLGLPVLRALGLPATIYVATGAIDDGPAFWVAAARALALCAPGDVLEVPGQTAIPLGPLERREVAAKTLTRALVPLRSDARATLLSEAAAAAGLDLDRMLGGTMLTWNQIRELHAAGWTIGAHTVTHANVALAAPEDAEADIVGSRDAVAAALGTGVDHFCYPNSGGQHRYVSPGVIEILRRHRFRSATTSRPGALRPDADRFQLPRLGVSPRLGPVVELATALERQRLAA